MNFEMIENNLAAIGSIDELEAPIDRVGDKLEDVADAIKTMPDRAIGVDCRLHLERSDLKAILACCLYGAVYSIDSCDKKNSVDPNQVAEDCVSLASIFLALVDLGL